MAGWEVKYVIFKWSINKVSINRANIVGFRSPNHCLVWTNVILDSGCEVPLNGMDQDKAESILREFDLKSESPEVISKTPIG